MALPASRHHHLPSSSLTPPIDLWPQATRNSSTVAVAGSTKSPQHAHGLGSSSIWMAVPWCPTARVRSKCVHRQTTPLMSSKHLCVFIDTGFCPCEEWRDAYCWKCAFAMLEAKRLSRLWLIGSAPWRMMSIQLKRCGFTVTLGNTPLTQAAGAIYACLPRLGLWKVYGQPLPNTITQRQA